MRLRRSAPICIALLFLAACSQGFSDPSRAFAPAVEDGPRGTVRIHQPATLGVIDTNLRDVRGRPIGIGCDTCHGPAEDGRILASDDGNPEEMHASVQPEHGPLTCNSCHDPDDRRLLHLADGTQVAFVDTIQLCAQCHGVQYRDYTRGSHGGMTGHWDLRRGDRDRNHCVDCHAPHNPAWPQLLPVFPPMPINAHASAEQH